MSLPRRLGLMMTGLAGIFGIRTPPEPEVIAQMQPARPSEGRGPDGPEPGLGAGLEVVLPKEGPAGERAQAPPAEDQ